MESGREISVGTLLAEKLIIVPLSMATKDGNLRPAKKSPTIDYFLEAGIDVS